MNTEFSVLFTIYILYYDKSGIFECEKLLIKMTDSIHFKNNVSLYFTIWSSELFLIIIIYYKLQACVGVSKTR